MTGPLALWQRLNRDGTALSPALDDFALDSFARRMGVILPKAFCEFKKLTDGTDVPGATGLDKSDIAFWPLAKCQLENDCVVSFADYFDYSWAYAIVVKPMNENYGVVVRLPELLMVASSFDEFAMALALDADEIILRDLKGCKPFRV